MAQAGALIEIEHMPNQEPVAQAECLRGSYLAEPGTQTVLYVGDTEQFLGWGTLVDLHRQHLGGQPIDVAADGLGRLGGAADPPPELDPVGDVEAGVLLGLLDQPDHLTEEAGEPQLIGSSRSSATVSEPAEATAQPVRGVSDTVTSSPPTVICSPASSTVAAPAR